MPTLFSTLDARFKERHLHETLQLATKLPSMEKAKTNLQTEKIRERLANKQSPEKIFELIAHNNSKDSLLIDSLLKQWMTYAKDFNRQNQKHQESLFAAICRYYSPTPIKQMINKAIQNPSTVSIAIWMERERTKSWLDEKISPKLVLLLLDLAKTGDNTLT
ncbi:unnamed protein product [Phytophthora fragariaefolia]|uniref:Unnamed protein product n=1 Tax=Phytophthora fragariaefolia TaxID=1490495 RepID=A0A9W6TLP0_9STRA|nr:unnamed protein product [Phytophthora fragariaefolia]